MKTKTRNLIGSVLIYLGLLVIFLSNLYGYFISPSVSTLKGILIINILSASIILFGGLWGMRR